MLRLIQAAMKCPFAIQVLRISKAAGRRSVKAFGEGTFPEAVCLRALLISSLAPVKSALSQAAQSLAVAALNCCTEHH